MTRPSPSPTTLATTRTVSFKALLYFWEGQPAEGRKALDALNEKARQQKEPYSQFEITFGRAMLSADPSVELEQLRWLETWLQDPIDGLSEVDRDNFLAQVLRERSEEHTS